jgi:hypothetical protein
MKTRSVKCSQVKGLGCSRAGTGGKLPSPATATVIGPMAAMCR